MENFKKDLIRLINLTKELDQLEKKLIKKGEELSISGIVKVNDLFFEVKSYGVRVINFKDLSDENI
ncbi:MAG: hypothetical protein JXR68_06770 [Bacteroidales bacterium]|nr:hypothetical protein [Bacteroidales bacterium]